MSGYEIDAHGERFIIYGAQAATAAQQTIVAAATKRHSAQYALPAQVRASRLATLSSRHIPAQPTVPVARERPSSRPLLTAAIRLAGKERG